MAHANSMAVRSSSVPCTIALHDDAVSKTHVLCNSNLLPPGGVAYLVAPGAKRLCFAAKEAARSADEVSIHASIAKQFGFENQMRAHVEIVQDIETAMATHIELFFRDQHLSRADMWRLEALIDGTVLYQGQRLSYLGSNVANVDSIYIAGQRVDSAYVLHPHTKLIFRSGSARYILLVQVSQEMLECWNNGDLMYERLTAGFLPDLFSRWDDLKARHQVTMILFGRQLLPTDQSAPEGASPDVNFEDFFHVIAADVFSNDWRQLLHMLKKAFNDVRLPRNVSLAANGNMLEAISIAATEFLHENLDPHLATTGSAIIPVTAGAGLFEAEHELLRRTTRLLMGNSVGVDIVSLAPKPLHPVPLFRYVLKGSVEYALPHWADISYWSSSEDENRSHWLLPCASGDVQDICLTMLDTDGLVTSRDLFDHYDQNAFAPTVNMSEVAVQSTVLDGADQSDNHTRTTRTARVLSTASTKILTEPVVNANFTPLAKPNSAAPQSSSHFRPPKPAPPAHPLMQMGRKISVGPKGLALSSGVASTTVSVQHAQHGRNASTESSDKSGDDSPSNLAKQIRASLRRKPSQASFATSEISDAALPSNPIAIRTTEDKKPESLPDPASLMEKAVMEHSRSSGLDSPTVTPKPDGQMSALEVDPVEQQHAVMSPWLTLLNPCSPRKENMRVASEYRQWQNVFPAAVGPDTFRWESMTSPAILPLLRESRISSNDLEQRFEKKVRRLVADVEKAQSAMRRMIALRLSAGFQVVPTRKLKDTQMPSEKIERMLLSIGDFYHELRCLSDMEIQVSEYWRDESALEIVDTGPYKAKIQTFNGHKARPTKMNFGNGDDETDWSNLDDECVNPDVTVEANGFSKMRLVLIPALSLSETRLDNAPRELSDEERRIDGIQKLTQLWQRNRYFTKEQQLHYATFNHASLIRAMPGHDLDPDPLAIEYQTRDTSAVVHAFGTVLNEQLASSEANMSLFPKSEMYHSRNYDLAKLVKRLQEPPPRGVEMKDRRWLTSFHLKCFRGDEMTNWLLRMFKDLGSREDAVELGNQLMDKGIFTHVRGKHEFRDGNYFYQIKSAHRSTAYPDTAGIFAKGLGRSVPSTPITEMVKNSPTIRAIQGDSDSSSRGSPTPTLAPVDTREKGKIVLSQKLRYNVDQGRFGTQQSNQLELIDLHYDRIHSPDNCYHIQLEWSTTAPKLIREAVSRWSSLIESHGLKLVQLPLKEACKLRGDHPLDQTIAIKLALRPTAKVPSTPHLDPQAASPRAAEDQDGQHKAILRKLGFVLDLEAASSFPRKLDISYSWGPLDYQHTQFVHKSGLMLAQVSNDGKSDFLLARNRLAGQWTTATPGKKTELKSAEAILNDVVKFCRDEAALKAMYEEFNKPKVSPMSPLLGSPWTADADVPPMELPPHLTHRPQPRLW